MANKIPIADLIGKKFNRWAILKEVASHVFPGGAKVRFMLCECDCGTIREVPLGALGNGGSKSCGCWKREVLSKRFVTHGLSKYLPYRKVWKGMHERCYNSNSSEYEHYGERGIKICDEWLTDPMLFIKWAISHGYIKGLWIDRIDNDGDYEPNNCRFVTPIESRHNQRLLNSTNTSGFCGVCWDKAREKWYSQIKIGKKVHHLGRFNNIIRAAIAYDKIAGPLGRPINFV